MKINIIESFLKNRKKDSPKRYDKIKDYIKLQVMDIDKIYCINEPCKDDIFFKHGYIIAISDLIVIVEPSNIEDDIYYINAYHDFKKDDIGKSIGKRISSNVASKIKDRIKNKFGVYFIILDVKKYPRIYSVCFEHDRCQYANTIYKHHHKTCMKTINTSEKCINLDVTEENGTVAMRNIFTAEFVVKLSVFLNGKKHVVDKKKRSKKSEKNDDSKKYKKNKYLSPIRYENESYNNTISSETGNGTGKCKHIRREHFRVLKNGNIITVKSSIINPHKEDKVYRI